MQNLQNVLVIHVIMYILKISATRTIKISLKNIVKITVKIIGIQNILNCQITGIKKMGAKCVEWWIIQNNHA